MNSCIAAEGVRREDFVPADPLVAALRLRLAGTAWRVEGERLSPERRFVLGRWALVDGAARAFRLRAHGESEGPDVTQRLGQRR
jgi:hypothetical protein